MTAYFFWPLLKNYWCSSHTTIYCYCYCYCNYWYWYWYWYWTSCRSAADTWIRKRRSEPSSSCRCRQDTYTERRRRRRNKGNNSRIINQQHQSECNNINYYKCYTDKGNKPNATTIIVPLPPIRVLEVEGEGQGEKKTRGIVIEL